MSSTAIADVQARIATIRASFPAAARSTSASTTSFAGAMADATTALNPAGSSVDPTAAMSAALDAQGSVSSAMTALSGATPGAKGSQVIAAAEKYLGVPYVWGGTDPAKGLDCSGFVQRVYGDLGVELPRVSRDQARAGTPVASMDQALPGDLIAFGSPVDHIGIYAGDGKMIVAPSRGDVVKYQDVYRTPTAIRRIIPQGVGATAAAPMAAAAGGAPGPAQYASLFRASEQRNGLPPGLLNAIAKNESAYNPSAVSPAGARGLMQFMPTTAASLGIDPMDPKQAIDGAGRLMAENLRRFGSVDLALAAYNAGPGAVTKYGGIPPYSETRTYVQRVLATFQGA